MRRVGGSVGLGAAARNVLIAGDDPEDDDRLLVHCKSNTGQLAPALRYRIEGHEIEPMGLHAVAFDDEGEIDIWFVPIRPGDYRFYIESLETQGFSGVMHVR